MWSPGGCSIGTWSVTCRPYPSRPTIFYIDQDFQNSKLFQANVAVEWQILPDTSFTTTYLFVDGSSLPRSIDRNIGSPSVRTFTVADTGEQFAYHFFAAADRPFASFSRVIAFESTAESRYNGLTFELNRRWVWRKRGRRSLRSEVVPFVALTAAGLLLSTIGVAIASAITARDATSTRTLVIEAANISAYGIVWLVQFAILDRVLFRTVQPSAGSMFAGQRPAGSRSV